MSNSGANDEMGGGPASSAGGVRPRFGELASDALRYWEPRRALYNAALLAYAAVIAHFFTLALLGEG